MHMKIVASMAVTFFLIAVYGIALGCSGESSVIPSSAQSFVWVSHGDTGMFINEIKKFAKQESLSFSSTKIPGPWDMNYIKLMTPGDNEIVISNATAKNKYSVSITIYNKREKWRPYWANLRSYVRAKYRWRDM